MRRRCAPGNSSRTPPILLPGSPEPCGAKTVAFIYTLSIFKKRQRPSGSCLRFFYEYVPLAGMGHFIHTYPAATAIRCPPLRGEPAPVAVEGDIDCFTGAVWSSLNQDNKVSLFVRFIDLDTGKTEDKNPQ